MDFKNCPLKDVLDLSFQDDVRKELELLENQIIARGGFKITYQLEDSLSAPIFTKDPSDWELIISSCQEVNLQLLQERLKALKPLNLSINERRKLAGKVAELLETKRAELVALLILEVGKPIYEADAEIAEAIDFCNYYSLLLEKLSPQVTFNSEWERCTLFYEPKGVAAVISPWNFPIAIPLGMIIANLLVGNPVVFKPAEQANLCGFTVYSLLVEAGWPEEALIFAPGLGETAGDFLVKSAWVDLVMFTGSKAVGSLIQKNCSNTPSRNGFKKVIAEMGGKNAIFVDKGVDCRKAVEIVLASAFGYAGQKCSACSRLFVHNEIYEEFMEPFLEAVKSLRVGSARDFETFLPFLINEEAYYRTQKILESIKKESIRVLANSLYPVTRNAKFMPAYVLEAPPEGSSLDEELFAPIISVYRVANFQEALPRINSTSYALTGGVITKSRETADLAIKYFNCGNLYINRKITGAFVGRHPFGGRKFSGIGFKAGGPNYLIQLVNEKLVAELDYATLC